jgi:subtilisin family serine protease
VIKQRHARGLLVLRTAPGWELEHIAANRDVRAGTAAAALELDGGGAIDAAIRRRSPAMQASHAFYSRHGVDAGVGCGLGHLEYDDLEHEIGLSRTFRVAVDPHAAIGPLVEELSAVHAIEMVSPAYLCETPFDDAIAGAALDRVDRTHDRARELIGANRALDIESGDTALIVGLIDSGVDLDHPELVGRLRPGVSSVALKPDWAEGELRVISGARPHMQDVADDEGHGTGCAGLLAAIGYRIGRGVAGAARLLPIRALCGARGPRQATAIGLLPDIDSGLKTAVDLGARVINLSFGTPEEDIQSGRVPHIEVVRYALARDCILVAASGNTGKPGRFFPAALPGVIAVGAVDDDRRPASFTTRGDHVSISAPGVSIATAGIDGYAQHSGTSFAAPFVTGACALLVARAARWSHPLGPESARRVLIDSAQRFAEGADASGCGAGILDIPAALAAVDTLCREDADAV